VDRLLVGGVHEKRLAWADPKMASYVACMCFPSCYCPTGHTLESPFLQA
jgi:hypothetical protein